MPKSETHENSEFQLRGFNHLALVCKDMQETVKFYEEILGFRLVKTLEYPDGGQHFFLDMGNAFAEEDYNLFDVTEWRYGTGAGVQWFSPFGPLAVVVGWPINRLSIEDSPVFEF